MTMGPFLEGDVRQLSCQAGERCNFRRRHILVFGCQALAVFTEALHIIENSAGENGQCEPTKLYILCDPANLLFDNHVSVISSQYTQCDTSTSRTLTQYLRITDIKILCPYN